MDGAWGAALLLLVLGAAAGGIGAHLAVRRRAGRAGPKAEPPLWYWLRRGGLPQGPEPTARLLAMHLDGRLGDDVVVAEAGTDRWQPIAVLANRARQP